MSNNIQRIRALGNHLIDPELTAQIFEELPDGIVVIDQEGSIQLVNRQTELMFGYHRREMFDQPLEMLLPPDLKEVHVKHREGYIASPRVRPMGIGLVLIGLRKGGPEFEVQINLSPLLTPDAFYVIAVIRTLRKPTELVRGCIMNPAMMPT